jgi:uncharacterized protein
MIILVKVMPNSKKLEIIKLDEKNYKIKLDAPAIEGRANSRLVEVLSDYLNIPKSSIRIVKGLKSRNKIVKIA